MSASMPTNISSSRKCSEAEIQRFGFAGVRLGQDQHSAGSLFTLESCAGDFQGAVARAVVDDDHSQVRIIRGQRGPHGSSR